MLIGALRSSMTPNASCRVNATFLCEQKRQQLTFSPIACSRTFTWRRREGVDSIMCSCYPMV